MQKQTLWRPPTDVYETDAGIIVKVEIPGMREDDFEITVTDRQLVISGTRAAPSCTSYHNMEIQYGPFRTEVWVRWALPPDAIEAVYENGFLYVRLPKPKVHRVPINERE